MYYGDVEKYTSRGIHVSYKMFGRYCGPFAHLRRLERLTAVQTCHENCHRFIRTSCLQLVKRATLRFALLARKQVRRRFNVVRIFRRIALDFPLNVLTPVVGVEFLVGHERQCLWCNLLLFDLGQERFVFQIQINGAQTVDVDLGEMGVFPFLDDFFIVGFFDGVIENTLFQIGGGGFITQNRRQLFTDVRTEYFGSLDFHSISITVYGV